MHSTRMRTARFSGHLGGCLPGGCLPKLEGCGTWADTPGETPPWADTPLDRHPPPANCMLRYTPLTD